MKDGFVSVACGTPPLRLADCDYNAEQTFTMMRLAEQAGAKVLVLPELGLTGYTCGDLFYQDALLRGAEQALATVLEATRNLEVVTAVGLPVRVKERLYNCAAIIQKGVILGLVPKVHLPNYGEFYEKRQFTPGPEDWGTYVPLCGQDDEIYFKAGQIFRCENIPELTLGFEICEDLWSPEAPSIQMAQAGATIIGNLSASNDLIGKDAYRRQLVTMQSAKLLCGYLYASAGEGESTSDVVFGAHQLIAENGALLGEQRFENGLLISEIDVQKLSYERRRTQMLEQRSAHGGIVFSLTPAETKLTRYIAPKPFVPEGKEDRDARCREILLIASLGLKQRLEHTGAKTAVVGLSGGLDSSLVCAISAIVLGKKIRTFAIGMDTDAIDLKYARQAADFIGADHTEFYMTRDEVLESLEEVIALLGTWDITTIRASMGMYLCCKAIHEKTDIRVLLTGEISDELFGYKYTDFAPSAGAFQQESKKRVDELHMYDVLRADRCISVNSLEARVPFGDLDFVKYVMAVDPALKMNTYGMGKYLLRHAFEKDRLLPDSILWRQKAAFSDAVGHSMVDDLKAYAEEKYTDSEFETRRKQYDYCPPFTKESLLYREIFEQCYPGQARMIRDFWMPNRSWEGCDVDDPSARVLSNYGQSGM